MALVNSYKTASEEAIINTTSVANPNIIGSKSRPTAMRKISTLDVDGDPDLQRALDLVDLHYGVKEKHRGQLDAGLKKARADVDLVLRNQAQFARKAGRVQ